MVAYGRCLITIVKDNVTTPYYPISALLPVKWLLMGGYKERKISNFLLTLQVVVVANERWLLTRGSKYSDLNWKLFVFLENWLLRRGDHCKRWLQLG